MSDWRAVKQTWCNAAAFHILAKPCLFNWRRLFEPTKHLPARAKETDTTILNTRYILTQKSFQPNNLKSKLKLNLANTSTCLKPISTTPVRRSFKSAVEEAGMMEEVELLDDDEVFIKDLDLNIVHKLSLRDMPFLPAVF